MDIIEKPLPPHAAALSRSMRDLGYSLETAIADLIDNSITAGAKYIRIFFSDAENMSENASLAIIDDGAGMSDAELFEAMRPGSRDPREERDADDLGRFGLGLKTASFSQCRELTVVSRKSDAVSAAQWDLDTVTEKNDWVIKLLPEEMILDFPYIEHLGKRGTYVLWRKMDRLLEGSAGKKDVYSKLEAVEHHLALVFHRYLSGKGYKNRKISIFINGREVEPVDPFCTSHKATQMLPEQIVRIEGEEIKIQPFILPHHSKLTKKEHDFYKTRSDFVSNQGAYIYRNGRLMAWGDWFRLIPKGESTKLARVRIDFSNKLDELWTIDIKKSRAYPPAQVKEALRQIINRVAEGSGRVHTGRGNRLFEGVKMPLWNRYKDRGAVRYELNRDHPVIISVSSSFPEDGRKGLEDIFKIIETGIPVEAIYADYSADPHSFESEHEIQREDMKQSLENIYMLMSVTGAVSREQFLETVSGMKPFANNNELTEELIGEIFDE